MGIGIFSDIFSYVLYFSVLDAFLLSNFQNHNLLNLMKKKKTDFLASVVQVLYFDNMKSKVPIMFSFYQNFSSQ